MTELLSMGPPVYWVLGTKLPLNDISNQNLICGGEGCNNNSIITELYAVSKYPEMYVFSFLDYSLFVKINIIVIN